MRAELPYNDRYEAGRALADALDGYRDRDDLLVLALPRGGVPVAQEVAERLGAPLDVMIVRKLGLPWQPELAMGAIASGNVAILDRDLIERAGVSDDEVEEVAASERAELARRESTYRGDREQVSLAGRCVILIDDGLATGSTARAAIAAARRLGAARVVLAVPVGPSSSIEDLKDEADDVVCPAMPAEFRAIGEFYRDFRQLTDEEVKEALHASGHAR